MIQNNPHVMCTDACDWDNVSLDVMRAHLAEKGTQRAWITDDMVLEALADPYAYYIPPIEASKSGQSSQTYGHAISSDEYLIIVVLHTEHGLYVLTAYEAKRKKKRLYLENKEKEKNNGN